MKKKNTGGKKSGRGREQLHLCLLSDHVMIDGILVEE